MIKLDDLNNHIEEVMINDIKKYHKPKTFIEYCKACKHYNKIWTCPPYDFDTLDIIDEFNYAYIIGSKINLNKLKEEYSKDLNEKGLEHVSNVIYTLIRKVIDERLRILEDKISDIKILLAGRCILCESCTKVDNKPCKYPEDSKYSLESLGFDLSSMSEEILKEKILWGDKDLPEYFILISGIFSEDKLDKEYIEKILNA